MFKPNNSAAVIPCFNEAASIASLVPAVRRHVPCVIVVDDGSSDGTGDLARAAGAVVLQHEENRGKGAALKTGLSFALQQGRAWAVTLDGDGQHFPEDLPALFRCAQETDAALVVGNRMAPKEARKMCWLRRQVNRWMSRQLSRQAGTCLPDTQCGFRLIHLETWAAMSLEAERFEVESETLMAFVTAGQRVEFVPVQVKPGGRKSHICPLEDTLRWFKWWRVSQRAKVNARSSKEIADCLAAQ